MSLIRGLMRATQVVAPGLAARLAERLFFTPPRTRASGALRAFLAGGRRFGLRVEGRRVVGWRWGQEGGPVVYLVHGWGGRGGRLGALVHPLRNAGYAVVTFDAPGHGASGLGMSSIPEFARALTAVVALHGPAHAVIAHSLGAAGTALAVSWGLAARRLVFLAPPMDPAAWLTPFARALALRQEVVAQMQARSERRLRFRWADLDVREMARAMTVSLLVVHDQGDETVPWRDGAAIAAAWPGARLVTTQGLGHRGVVRVPDVVGEVVAFVAADGAPLPLDASARLESELFYREARWTRS
ncbi:MAG: hypothetical protein AUH78_01830 [Gemmatimonadetes bacterium 13_1_40CM_4_69_8]|nr:MAG: hypothetical protein AUH78_01830 [Gemmatimonadetes bacterium 13_1_40CM_4_69_8]